MLRVVFLAFDFGVKEEKNANVRRLFCWRTAKGSTISLADFLRFRIGDRVQWAGRSLGRGIALLKMKGDVVVCNEGESGLGVCVACFVTFCLRWKLLKLRPNAPFCAMLNAEDYFNVRNSVACPGILVPLEGIIAFAKSCHIL